MALASHLPTLRLAPQLESALRSGHPWIYRNHLGGRSFTDGTWLRVEAGSAVAFGLYDASSAIAVRLYSQQTLPDEAWVAARVDEALSLRQGLASHSDTNAYRLLYGEGDSLPGIIVDRYERYAVLQTYAQSVQSLVPAVVKALSRRHRFRGILTRQDDGLQALYGQLPPPELTVQENGLLMLANLYQGQKTGLFLDHRDNRSYLQRYVQGQRLLNLFSYSGAFSLYALAAGAAQVLDVDSAAAALEDAKRNVALNGFDAALHRSICADCFAWLETNQERFDVVVLDPPSLARNKKSRSAALRAYRKLNSAAMQHVVEGGLLATASCTAQVSADDFRNMLSEAALAVNKRLQIIHEAAQAHDYPVPAHFPEGRYLKFVLARVLPLC